ncbi:hypothetical protein [Achromobacter sp. K91]|uniref:hypothetical protein n=1 Tax=Achromobacter sp. K91 TaxID=2292262 RepID=UPI001314B6F1|nr:hypothetical protein [Achromobacter sp. K91]
MAVIVLGCSIMAAIATACLVLIIPSPYDVVTALFGSGASVSLLALSTHIDE